MFIVNQGNQGDRNWSFAYQTWHVGFSTLSAAQAAIEEQRQEESEPNENPLKMDWTEEVLHCRWWADDFNSGFQWSIINVGAVQ